MPGCRKFQRKIGSIQQHLFPGLLKDELYKKLEEVKIANSYVARNWIGTFFDFLAYYLLPRDLEFIAYEKDGDLFDNELNINIEVKANYKGSTIKLSHLQLKDYTLDLNNVYFFFFHDLRGVTKKFNNALELWEKLAVNIVDSKLMCISAVEKLSALLGHSNSPYFGGEPFYSGTASKLLNFELSKMKSLFTGKARLYTDDFFSCHCDVDFALTEKGLKLLDDKIIKLEMPSSSLEDDIIKLLDDFF